MPVVVGNALQIPLPDGCVQACVTSPPYYGLRDYGVDGQIGSESSLDEFLDTMVDAMREVRRVLRDDGTVWLNMGDSYAGGHKQQTSRQRWQHSAARGVAPKDYDEQEAHRVLGNEFRPKCKMLVPHRLAIALCDDGWIVRQDIVWAKPNPMPESVTDRPTTAHEFMFLLAKGPRYYYDAEAVREPTDGGSPFNVFRGKAYLSQLHGQDNSSASDAQEQSKPRNVYGKQDEYNARGRNKRSVWTIPSHPFPDAHFATFPPSLVEPCIKAGTAQKVCPHCGAQWAREVAKDAAPASVFTETSAPDDGKVLRHRVRGCDSPVGMGQKRHDWRLAHPPTTTGWSPGCDCPDNDGSGKALVLDPFCGSGTTGVVARQMGRRFFGVELNPEYAAMARRRIAVDGDGRDRVEQADGTVHEQQVLAL